MGTEDTEEIFGKVRKGTEFEGLLMNDIPGSFHGSIIQSSDISLPVHVFTSDPRENK